VLCCVRDDCGFGRSVESEGNEDQDTVNEQAPGIYEVQGQEVAEAVQDAQLGGQLHVQLPRAEVDRVSPHEAA